MKKILIIFIATISLICQQGGAEENSKMELENLKKRLAILEEKISEKHDDILTLKLRPGPYFQTPSGETTFAIDGRIQVDSGFISKEKTSNENAAIALRRLWLGIEGNITKDWNYRALVGFENNQTSVYDTFIKYRGIKNLDVVIGNFFENNGIDIASGNLVTPLMERSSGIITFRQFRRTGISLNPHGDNWGAQLGFFGSNPSNQTTSAVNANNKGTGFSTRFHIAPINDKLDSHYLHLGFNNTYRELDSGTNAVTGSNKTMRFNSTGNTNVLSAILIDTGNITNVKNYYQNTLELRYQYKQLTLTSEFIKTTLNRLGDKVNFSGGYVMASYFLTPNHYNYNAQTGLQTMYNVDSKGAWEVATRFSQANLNDKIIKGGKLDSYDFGVNYYPNLNLKFMLDYVFNKTDSHALVKNNPQYVMARAQVNF